MKCIKKGDEIKRVQDKQALKMIKEGWGYCPKSDWKKKGRVLAKEDLPVAQEKKVKKSKKTKRTEKAEIKTEVKAEEKSKGTNNEG